LWHGGSLRYQRTRVRIHPSATFENTKIGWEFEKEIVYIIEVVMEALLSKVWVNFKLRNIDQLHRLTLYGLPRLSPDSLERIKHWKRNWPKYFPSAVSNFPARVRKNDSTMSWQNLIVYFFIFITCLLLVFLLSYRA